ncbi:hypothetical protein U0070_012556, partial [Myodes glareolus]
MERYEQKLTGKGIAGEGLVTPRSSPGSWTASIAPSKRSRITVNQGHIRSMPPVQPTGKEKKHLLFSFAMSSSSMLNPGVNTQLLPGAQHTYFGPDKKKNGRVHKEPQNMQITTWPGSMSCLETNGSTKKTEKEAKRLQ